MEQDTPSIAVRLRWGGMRFLGKTKIQHFLLTSFQHLNDLYPCSRMANNLNFGNCYGLTFPISRNQKSRAFVMAPACNVCFTFETHSVVWLKSGLAPRGPLRQCCCTVLPFGMMFARLLPSEIFNKHPQSSPLVEHE